MLTAPLQVKPTLSLANLYDLVIADFFAKVRQLQGIEVHHPLIWNINGDPILKLGQMHSPEFTIEILPEFVNGCLQSASVILNAFGVTFTRVIRDDEVQDEINALLQDKYSHRIKSGILGVTACRSCGTHFGADPGITTCKYCKGVTERAPLQSLYIRVEHPDLLRRARQITWIPESAFSKLVTFIDSLPHSYELVISKPRKKSLLFNGFSLDPRFTAILCYGLLPLNRFSRVTLIHGDVTKKLDYYLLSYLDPADLPHAIVTHAPCLGSDGKKLRWQDQQGKENKLDISPKVLRCIFLKRHIRRSVQLSRAFLQPDIHEPTKLFLKIRQMLQRPTSEADGDISGIQEDFLCLANQFELPQAYATVRDTVNLWWEQTKYRRLTRREGCWLNEMRRLYFGE